MRSKESQRRALNTTYEKKRSLVHKATYHKGMVYFFDAADTLCGTTFVHGGPGDKTNTNRDWQLVTCKRCLKLKRRRNKK